MSHCSLRSRSLEVQTWGYWSAEGLGRLRAAECHLLWSSKRIARDKTRVLASVSDSSPLLCTLLNCWTRLSQSRGVGKAPLSETPMSGCQHASLLLLLQQ